MNSGSPRKLAQPKALAKHNAIIRPIAAYGGLFTLLVGVVSIGYYQPTDSSAGAVAALASQTTSAEVKTSSVDAAIDERVVTSIAANFAMQADMPTAANVANLNTTLEVKEDLAQIDETVISKPQIVQPTAEVRSITTYTAQAGDTAQSVAEQFGLTVDTIKWVNNLASDAIEEGRSLTILPTNGVLHAVTTEDTLESLAAKYGVASERIVSFNDLELTGLSPNAQIIIPGGILPENERPGYVDPAQVAAQQPEVTPLSSTGGAGQSVSWARATASAGNAYAFGNCTWYAYERRAELGRPIGSFWGNATSWASSGRAAGFAVNNTPAPGAIMQNYGGYGHVAIVEAVHPDGSITYSDMNGVAGFNRVGTKTISAGAAAAYNYIH